MTSASCAHDELEFTAEVHEDGGSAPAIFRYAVLKARCAGCQALFHWRGLQSGVPNPDAPVVSADGFELRAPILPGPGAVVGLLEHAGLVDKLIDEKSPTWAGKVEAGG